jgi:hypothetical protein
MHSSRRWGSDGADLEIFRARTAELVACPVPMFAPWGMVGSSPAMMYEVALERALEACRSPRFRLAISPSLN